MSKLNYTVYQFLESLYTGYLLLWHLLTDWVDWWDYLDSSNDGSLEWWKQRTEIFMLCIKK